MTKAILFTILTIMCITIGYARENGNVMIYSSSSCAPCHEAKAHLRDLGVKFNTCDIEKSASCKAKYDQAGGIGTPLIFVNGDRMDGYEQSQLDALLRKHGYLDRNAVYRDRKMGHKRGGK